MNPIQCDGFILEVVRLPRGAIVNWGLKATMNKQDRYRAYYYKADAIRNIEEWRRYDKFGFKGEFWGRHNWQTLNSLMKEEGYETKRN
jgi:hypothetical protein